ncbi:hypothetical protein [Rhizobium sp. BT03]|uniref:hypothetical protein n=1 Tax=Rhizobium sp. BT03 TaxID=3045156 RepID=UPI0024B3CBC1|nr:hypothetical protein [Rhizobium sp. BT03]WHO75809.1 hypothetical protein QMO80_004911 [Rhizobium sp. BT03]
MLLIVMRLLRSPQRPQCDIRRAVLAPEVEKSADAFHFGFIRHLSFFLQMRISIGPENQPVGNVIFPLEFVDTLLKWTSKGAVPSGPHGNSAVNAIGGWIRRLPAHKPC